MDTQSMNTQPPLPPIWLGDQAGEKVHTDAGTEESAVVIPELNG
jgi:hypothetical protein